MTIIRPSTKLAYGSGLIGPRRRGGNGAEYPANITTKYESSDGVNPTAASIKAEWKYGADQGYAGWYVPSPAPSDFTGTHAWHFGTSGGGTWPGGLVAYSTALGATDNTGPGCNNIQVLAQVNSVQAYWGYYVIQLDAVGGGAIALYSESDITQWRVVAHNGTAWTQGTLRNFVNGGDFRNGNWHYVRLWYNDGVISVKFWRNTLANEPAGYDLYNYDLRTDFTGAQLPPSFDMWSVSTGGAWNGAVYVGIHDWNIYFGQGTP